MPCGSTPPSAFGGTHARAFAHTRPPSLATCAHTVRGRCRGTVPAATLARHAPTHDHNGPCPAHREHSGVVAEDRCAGGPAARAPHPQGNEECQVWCRRRGCTIPNRDTDEVRTTHAACDAGDSRDRTDAHKGSPPLAPVAPRRRAELHCQRHAQGQLDYARAGNCSIGATGSGTTAWPMLTPPDHRVRREGFDSFPDGTLRAHHESPIMWPLTIW